MGFSKYTPLLGLAFVAGLVEAQGPLLNTTSTVAPVYTTEVVTALTTVCPSATVLTVNNKVYTVTSSTTLTITDCPCTISKPVTPTGGVSQCAQGCMDAYNKCRSDPNANRSTCAAQYASCLGYSPYGSDGSLITPTACSTTAAATTTAATTAAASSCPQKCYDAYNTCRGQPDANRATCAAEYAGCLGYSPFDSNGSLVTPTACSGSAVATAAKTTAPAVVTAGAGRLAPVGGLLALGAVALL